MEKRVSVIALDSYNAKQLVAAVGRHFDALRVWEELRPGMRVLLKPNLLARYAPEAGVTTHPAVVEAVAVVLGRHGVKEILLADSPGGPYTRPLLESIYRATGMAGAAQRAGILLNTDTSSSAESCPEALLCRSFDLIAPVPQADYIINLPKLKTHGMMMMTGGVKNLFGCVPGLLKPELHFRFPKQDQFARMLVDLALLVRPGITLVDGIEAMEGNGPSGGAVRRTGMIFAARNVFALDLALSEFVGFRPEQVPTVAESLARGLCPAGTNELEWLLDGRPEPVTDYRHPRSKPLAFTGHMPRWLGSPMEWVEKKFLSPRPVVNKNRCIGCGKCAESCAPGAMVIREGKAVLELERCIRCYCCHEMCPVRAIDIRRARLLGR